MTQHTENSSYREKLIEHLFVAELLKLSWLHHGCLLEIATPEVDNAGYDLIAEESGLVRHIQLKTSVIGGKTASQKVHTRLAEKPSGCVVWIYFDEKTLELGPFLYFLWLPRSGVGAGPDALASRHASGRRSGQDCASRSVSWKRQEARRNDIVRLGYATLTCRLPLAP
jgi:hypothetical protein